MFKITHNGTYLAISYPTMTKSTTEKLTNKNYPPNQIYCSEMACEPHYPASWHIRPPITSERTAARPSQRQHKGQP